MNRVVKRLIGGVIAALGTGMIIAFVLSKSWFGVLLGLFVALLGFMALWSPDDVFRKEAKQLPLRGAGRPEGEDG